MESRTLWFFAGLAVLALLAMNFPKLAGGITVLIVVVLALRLAQKKIL